jgi:hypothetical protein
MYIKNNNFFVIVIRHEKVKTIGIEQGFGTRLYFTSMLNKLNMGVLPLFIPFWGFSSQKFSMEVSICPSTKNPS